MGIALRVSSAVAIGLVIIAAQVAFIISVPQTASAYTPHTPIVITSNAGFNAGNGVTGGNGLPGDPYIIEGWDINASSSVGIDISSTDAYFTIRNVYVHDSTMGSYGAIYIHGVKNGRLENSKITGKYGDINTNSCTNLTIIGNEVTGTGGDSLGIIVGYNSDHVLVKNNTVTFTRTGIYAGGSNVTVEGNILQNNREGIDVGDMNAIYQNVVLKNNQILNNDDLGVYLVFSHFGLLTGNRIESNGWASGWGGIFVANDSAHWTISRNVITNNNGSGIGSRPW